ncbi:hypothetical protein ZIOFF_000269 [Zingiber officinale]|uniref:Polyprotein n=1 Tax=Zingiber officinale TaxID=94328 RepID=A0A8J5LRB7_ZINOF|nr:hypothetical protein ZIOFF_000269 [Zingiber officinale]
MQVLNLIHDFEMQKMKKTETIKEYADRLLGIANRVRLLGSSLTDSRIVEKIIVTLPERFETTITTFENTKDLTRITLAELLNALQAQEQRRAMRREGEIEGALPARHNDVGNFRKQKNKNPQAIGEGSLMGNKNKAGDKKAGAKVNYPPCHHCGKKGHPPFKCWRRPDAKCRKCNQMGHEAVICKNKNPQQEEETKVADQDEDQLFVATCFASNVETESWLIDSGCTNHMTNDKELFKDLHPTKITKVRIGNGDYISVKGKGMITITNCSGTKLISEVLFVPEIYQNLLSVGQLIEKGFKVVFEDNFCLIKDAANQDIFKIKMKGKSFALKPLEEEQTAFSIRENVTEIWHKRLGHYHHQGMLQMKSKMILEELPEFADQISYCRACQFGYSNVSKAYKVFQPQTGNIIVSRDVYFMENEAWNWEDTKKKNQTVTDLKFKFSNLNIEDEEGLQDEAVDDVPVRGTRLLSDIYERCNIAKEESVMLIYCKSEDQLADLFTKPLPVSKFEFLRQEIGVCSS